MEIIKDSIRNINKICPDESVVTIGTFDGFHKYHQKIISQAQRIAKRKKMKLIVISFEQKVKSFLNKQNDSIINPEDKTQFLTDHFDIDYFIDLKLDNYLVNTTKEQFIEWLKVNLNAKYLVEGQDFTFGNKGEGNVTDLINEFGIENVYVQKKIGRYSSSKIKEYIADGKVDKANKMLGLPFTLFLKEQKNNNNINSNIFDIVYPNIKIKDGHYKALINEKKPAKVVINKDKKLSFTFLESSDFKNIKKIILVELIN